MSVAYCYWCNEHIDTDEFPEHFNYSGSQFKCISDNIQFSDFALYEVPVYLSQRDPNYSAEVECRYCNAPIPSGVTAISEYGHTTNNQLPCWDDWFCSWNCIAAVKKREKERAFALVEYNKQAAAV